MGGGKMWEGGGDDAQACSQQVLQKQYVWLRRREDGRESSYERTKEERLYDSLFEEGDEKDIQTNNE